jgi:tetratricopeptide (TPR) repeat protein
MKHLYLSLTLAAVFGCASQTDQKSATISLPPGAEAVSFSGKPLYVRKPDSSVVRRSDSLLNILKSKPSLSEDDYVEVGRLLVTQNRYRDAIAKYTEGISMYPESFKLYRYRGHRYINLRQIDDAMIDLGKARDLMESQPEAMEFGGDGKPTATTQHQVWYHIGIYHYLKKDYASCAAAFEKALQATKEPNNIAGASDWLYNAYQRMGDKVKAENVLAPFTLDYPIEDKNYPYFRRLLLFKKLITPEELIEPAMDPTAMSVQDMTKLYGLANFHAYNGNAELANELYKKVLLTDQWLGFAYAGAELDVKP